MIIIIGIVVLFIELSIIFLMGKDLLLITKYYTLGKKENIKIDKKVIGMFVCKIMFSLAFNYILFMISEVGDIRWLFYIGLLPFLVVIIYVLIIAETVRHFY